MDEDGEGDGKVNDQYATDEKEFMGMEVCVSDILLGGSRLDTTPAVTVPPPVLDKGTGRVENTAKHYMSVTRRIRKKTAHNQGYQLAFFNLWCNRMDREGQKEGRAKEKREEVEYAGDHGDEDGRGRVNQRWFSGC